MSSIFGRDLWLGHNPDKESFIIKEKDKIGTKDKNAWIKLAYEEVIQNDVTMTSLKLSGHESAVSHSFFENIFRKPVSFTDCENYFERILLGKKAFVRKH